MKRSLVITLMGQDRPGLVEGLSRTVEEHGGNWEESRMVHLAGEFVGLLHVHVDTEKAEALEQALGRLEGLTVMARASDEPPEHGGTRLLQLEVVGHDQPGIVRRLAAAVAARGVNVEELESEVLSAPMSGERLFQARAKLRAPIAVPIEDLESDLEKVSADLMIEVRLAGS